MGLPATGTWAVKPYPLGNRGKANPVPLEGAQVVLTRLRGLTQEGREEREKEEGRGKQGLGRGDGRKEPLCRPPFPHHNPQEQQQSVMQIVTPPPA